MRNLIQHNRLWLSVFLLSWFCKDLHAQSRVSNILLEPITYSAGPPFAPGVHAYVTLDVLPGNEIAYFNARLTNTANNITVWSIQNLPLLPADEPSSFSFVINTEKFGVNYTQLRCAYTDTAWQTSPNFVTSSIITLTPIPVEYHVPSGSSDPPIQIQSKPDKPKPPGKKPIAKEITYLTRDKVMPNIDLDKSKDPTDFMACGPAAAANSLQWLKTQHKELQGDTTSLRSKTDSLKKYMNRSDAVGVRFDSMVVGKLTLIDQLKLPIKVKYKTKHGSGNPAVPLKSTKPPFHTADNKGAKDVFPDFEWLKKEMDDGEDVEVHVGWYGPPDKKGERKRVGGHWVVASGYSIVKNEKGIYVKEDNDQRKKGGLRSTYFRWKTLPKSGEPYLENLKDDKGNIAIVESVVSESFDPTVKFDYAMSTVPPPWDKMDLTSEQMKPGYPFVVKDGSFPWLPVIVGIVAVGTGTYFLTKEDDEDPEPCSFTISAPTASSTCGMANGSAFILTNPPDNYTYTWSNGATTSSINEVSAGTYSVTVTISGTTCSQTLSVPISNNNPILDASISTMDADCGQNNGSAIVTVTPSGTYTYQWSNGSTEQNQTNLAAGQYSLTVSAGVECVNSYSVQIGETPFEPNINITTTSSGCGLSDGTARATIDPPGEYTYAWSNGQSGPEATDLASGNYTITVSLPETNCTSTTTFTVDELPAGHTVSVTTTSSGCGLTDGTATATVDPPGEYIYAWSDGQSGPEATGLGAGEYTISVSVAGSTCTQVTTFTVDELPAGHTISVTTTSSGCGLTDGTSTATVDPPGEYIYAWSDGQSGPEATGLAAGQYSVSVSVPGSSCFVVQQFTIDQSTTNFTGTITTENASCGLADGTATATIDPPGEYTYAWSDGQSTSVAEMLSSGAYTLVVTDSNQCSVQFSLTIEQDSAEYISIVSTTPGTCQGGGEITFTLNTPGDGTLVFHADGPEGTTTQTLAPGSYQLSAFISVASGDYTMTVYDQSIGTDCQEMIDVNVLDNTPALTAIDDFFETPGGASLNGNALDNDSGLDIGMTSVSDVFGGSVTFLSTGEFDFIPDPGFSGDASFVYMVTDACGTTTTAIVTIIVAETNCEFSTEFTFIPASCGLDDGAIAVEVFEPGSYDYLWSNGDSGPSINALFAGTYTVTITDLNLGCDLEFTVDLPENPAEHIDDVILTQPACGVDGEVQFTVTSNSQNPLVMSVDHPNGSDVFFIDPGVILLSDYLSITAGNYTIEIFDAGAGSGCAETLDITLVATPSIEIIAEAVIPPSEPTAMDGLVIIVAIVPGILPYEILLNGSSWGVAIDHVFQVTGLGTGTYMIQLVDAAGCTSNLLEVVVPVPPITLFLGTSILQTSVYERNHEPVAPDKSSILWRSVLTSSLRYYIGRVRQEVITRYAVPVRDLTGFVEVHYLTDIARANIKGVSLAMQGGLGSHFERREDITSNQPYVPTYFLLRASGGYTLAHKFRLQVALEMKCWEKHEVPRVEIGLSIPFAGSGFRRVR